MATLKIEPGMEGKLWVTLTYFSKEDVARLDGTTLARCEKQRIMDVPSAGSGASLESGPETVAVPGHTGDASSIGGNRGAKLIKVTSFIKHKALLTP